MRKGNVLIAVTSIVLTVSVASGVLAKDDGSSNSDHEQTFARFDEVYIPALALTKQEKAKPSTAALRRLTQRWQQLRPKLAEAMKADAEWAEDLETVDRAIRESARQAKEGKFAEAHETLEVIRDLMMEARVRQQIAYALDSLSDFHTTMEEIVKPAMKFTSATVTEQQIQGLESLCAVADEKWKVAEATKFNLNAFGIDPAAAGQLGRFIKLERQAINDLQAALENGDKQTIIQAARDLKPPFAKTYMFFGDFPQPVKPEGKARTNADASKTKDR